MLRPIAISNNVHFGAKTFDTSGEKKSAADNEYNKSDKQEINQDIRNGIIIGAIAGAILSGATVSMYKDGQIKDMFNEISEEMSSPTFEGVEIKDINEDGIKDIVLKDRDGFESVYDLTSGAVYIKEGDDIIEQLR